MDLRLRVMPDELSVCRLAPDAPRPTWAGGGFVSVTRTPTELCVVSGTGTVPADVRSEPGWRALVLAGEFDFNLVGVLKRILDPLAEAGVPVFAISTYDTDYVLVRRLDEAVRALDDAGIDVLGG
jgi:uncharacterized protein